MKDTGKMISHIGKEERFILKEIVMKEVGLMVNIMEREHTENINLITLN